MTSAQANFAEAAFTVGRFAEAEQRLAALVDDPKLKPGNLVPLRALEICSLVALDRPRALGLSWRARRQDTLRAKLNALSDLLKGDRVNLRIPGALPVAGTSSANAPC